MKSLIVFTKASFKVFLTYRAHFIITTVVSLLYSILLFYLWHAIYQGNAIQAMTFNEVFTYLVVGSLLSNLFQTWAENDISYKILSGGIITDLLKPVDFQMKSIFSTLGFVLCNLVFTVFPSLIAILIFFNSHLSVNTHIGIFICAIILAYLINFHIDFMLGLFSFYSESIIGVSYVKSAIVLFMSGAILPFTFFPAAIRNILELLPFQAIYNIPLKILTNQSLSFLDCIRLLGIQLLWALVMIGAARWFYGSAIKRITINGG